MFNFKGMSDYDIAVFMEAEGPFSPREYSDIVDAIFRREGYYLKFDRYVRAVLVRNFSIRDADTQDELVQDAMMWLVSYLEQYGDSMINRMQSPEKLNFANLLFQMRGIKKSINDAMKLGSRETGLSDDFEAADSKYVASGRSSTSSDWDASILLDKFKKRLTSIQATVFELLSQDYTVREIADEIGKSNGTVMNIKSDLEKLYRKHVMSEARRFLKSALREAFRSFEKKNRL